MPTLEQITYDAGRHLLADQEALVSGIRQRTGTLLTAHALVASFLGTTTITATGLNGWSWAALAALVLGLVVAAILLAPWDLAFAVDPHDLYDRLYQEAAARELDDSQTFLASAGYAYKALRDRNTRSVERMSRLSGLVSTLVVIQMLLWIADLVH